MPTIPFRGLAQRGILHDPSPYDLPDDAYSGGSNVLFSDTKAQRAPVFRGVVDPLPDPPAFVVGQPASSGFDKVVYAGRTGRLWQYFSGTTTEVTPSGFSPATVSGTFTSAFLGDVIYVNNPNAGLFYQGPAGGNFAKDPHWDATWSAAVFRVYKDYPVALNVTKGAQPNPSLVKWGDNTLAGLTTSSWDSTDPTTNAGETPISDLTGPILDGLGLKDSFVIYSQDQVWEMTVSGDQFVFSFRRLFSEGGIVGTNCVAEVNGMHFVFGPTDIYVHDGVEKKSILDKRNRRWVYRNMNKALASRCFVQHLPDLHCLVFAYVSTDADAAFPGPPTGCNRAILYNYVDDVMGPIDLPNVTSMTVANLNSVLTWATAGSITWATMGGSWADQADSYGRIGVAVSGVMPGLVTHDRLLGYDFLDKGQLGFPSVPELNAPAFLERIGLDLDADGAALSMYKVVKRIYPQVQLFRNVPVTVQAGGAPTAASPVVWLPAVPFDPATQYKVDVRIGGRYLAYRISVLSPADFEVTGMDAEFINNGSR